MSSFNRREFLQAAGGAGLVGVTGMVRAEAISQQSRVVVIRHENLCLDSDALTVAAVRGLLDQAAIALARQRTAADAWASWFSPSDRLAIKVNCLGLPTHPVVSTALAAAICGAGVAPANTIIWDRTDRELVRAGYKLVRDGDGVRCFGTDSLGGRWSGYDDAVSNSGRIGSLYSRIVTDGCDALISAAVLKDHNLAGLSCTLKNFFGAIHNPNKYHENGCDPFVADVCAHHHIKDRLRLALCDATRPQYNGGPPSRPVWQWPYGGLILSTDPVALDRVALEIIECKRQQEGMGTLESEDRPVRYLASAEARGLGNADLSEIEVVSIGRPWRDVT